MDSQHFDEIARTFAERKISRRQALKSLLIGFTGVMMGGPLAVLTSRKALADCSLLPPPENLTSFCVSCEQFLHDVADPGVLCPPNVNKEQIFKPNRIGCTQPRISLSLGPTQLSPTDFVEKGKGKNKTCCASATFYALFLSDPKWTGMTFQPDPKPCCSESCSDEITRMNNWIIDHEGKHVSDTLHVVGDANVVWTSNLVSDACVNGGCNPKNRLNAEKLLQEKANQAALDKLTEMYKDLEIRDSNGDNIFSLNCEKCNPPPGPEWTLCCNETCVNPLRDPNNCGTCGNTCSTECCYGHCCPENTVCCEESKSCVDLQSDPNNCGYCGNTCSSKICCHGECCQDNEICTDSGCGLCPEGTQPCGGGGCPVICIYGIDVICCGCRMVGDEVCLPQVGVYVPGFTCPPSNC